jgi:D-alanine-D-alanine ligase
MIKIDIIYDPEDPSEDNYREASASADTEQTANQIFKALKSKGHKVTLTAIDHDNYKETISNLSSDIIFNQVEEDELGFDVLKFIEKIEKKVTGVGSTGYKLSWNKVKIKEKLVKANIPTPNYLVVKPGDKIDLKDLKYPLFVKATDDHGSLSVNEKSCVKNEEELIQQVAWIKNEIGDDSLVEEYVDGRELGVTLIGNGHGTIILPVKEILFGEQFLNRPKVVTYEAKWAPDSKDYLGTTSMSCPAKLSHKEMKAIEKAVLNAFKTLLCRDYVRFDIRLKNDVPYIIDYNANPGIGINDASSLPAKVYGLTYPNFIEKIVTVAIERYGL